MSLIERCNCIMAAHCSPTKAGCRLKAGGTVNAGGGVCGPKDEEEYVPANPPGAVEALEIIAGANENATTIPTDHDRLVAIHALLDPPGTSLKSIEELIEELIRGEGAVKERDRLREVLRAVLMEPDPIKRNQLAAPELTTPGGGSIPGA